MEDFGISGGNSYIAPTDEQLLTLGRVFGEKVKASITRKRLTGGYDEGVWDFEIEGARALATQDGFVRNPDLTILPGQEEWNTPTERVFAIATSRWNEDDERLETDCYRVTFLKNTEIVSGLSKAVITNDLIDFLEEQFGEHISERMEKGGSIIDAYRAGSQEFRDKFYQELSAQFDTGACFGPEVTELIEMLERSTPKTVNPFGSLLSQFIEE